MGMSGLKEKKGARFRPGPDSPFFFLVGDGGGAPNIFFFSSSFLSCPILQLSWEDQFSAQKRNYAMFFVILRPFGGILVARDTPYPILFFLIFNLYLFRWMLLERFSTNQPASERVERANRLFCIS